MNSLTNSFHLNSPYISSAFLPSQMKTNSLTTFLKNQNTPLLEKSPLFVQNSTFEKQLLSTGMERSSLSNKESGIFSNPGSGTVKPIIVKYDIFSPTINKYNFSNTTLSINQNFFQMESNSKKPNSFGEINTFLFKQIPERQVETKSKKKKNTKPVVKKVKKEKEEVMKEKSGNNIIIRNRNKSINSFSNNTITNVINNNFVFEIHNVNTKENKTNETTLIKKKRGRKSKIDELHKKPIKLKKKDKTIIKIFLNQIKIQGITLKKFPLITIPEDSLSVDIFQRLVYEGNYFEIEDTNEIQKYTFSQQRLNKKTFYSYFKKEKDSYSSCLYLVDENEKEEDPYLILKNYYTQIKSTVLQIQKNFIGKKKGSLNKEQTDRLYKLILSCNFVIGIILNYKPISYNKINISTFFYNNKGLLRKLKNGHYKCPFCVKCFTKGQGLGGHMSRHHPSQSEKYKEKMTIRERRTSNRLLLKEIKAKFFAKYDKNYKEMLKRGEKEKIQAFLINHKSEYLLFRKREQKQYRKSTMILKTIKSTKNKLSENNENNNLYKAEKKA